MSPAVADDERVAVEDLDQVVAHAILPRARRAAEGRPGRTRWISTSSSGSPSSVNSPRRKAAMAFTSPLTIPSNSVLSARTMQSAARVLARHRNVAPVERHEPALDPAALDEVEANGALAPSPAAAHARATQSSKNSARRIGHRHPPSMVCLTAYRRTDQVHQLSRGFSKKRQQMPDEKDGARVQVEVIGGVDAAALSPELLGNDVGDELGVAGLRLLQHSSAALRGAVGNSLSRRSRSVRPRRARGRGAGPGRDR